MVSPASGITASILRLISLRISCTLAGKEPMYSSTVAVCLSICLV